MNGIRLDNIFVVLSHPKGPINVGASARAMNNMGIRDLVLVAPCDHTGQEARKMASGCNETLLGARVFRTTREAVADAGYIAGMTCRGGKSRQNVITPEELAGSLVEISRKNRVALLFGTERTGLTNDEIDLCDTLVTIPTSEMNVSLNLAQAVLIICYEIFKAAAGYEEHLPRQERTLATSEEMEGMYRHMEDVFQRIGYLNPQNPGHIMRAIRNIFARANLDPREVKIIRGMIGKIDSYRKWIERGKAGRKKQKRL